ALSSSGIIIAHYLYFFPLFGEFPFFRQIATGPRPWHSSSLAPRSLPSVLSGFSTQRVKGPRGQRQKKAEAGPSSCSFFNPLTLCVDTLSCYSISNPWLVNFSVLLFSVTVRTT